VRVSPGQQRLTRHPWSVDVVEHGVRTAVLCDTTVICVFATFWCISEDCAYPVLTGDTMPYMPWHECDVNVLQYRRG